jgi:hypothetical protein
VLVTLEITFNLSAKTWKRFMTKDPKGAARSWKESSFF